MDVPHRPMVPPKPDKDKISVSAFPVVTSGCESPGTTSTGLDTNILLDTFTSPNSATETRKTSFNGHQAEEPGAPPKAPKPSYKPVLPPKPQNNSSPRLSSASSLPSPPTLNTPQLSSPKISPPLLPKGRNSLSIANAILSNANKTTNSDGPCSTKPLQKSFSTTNATHDVHLHETEASRTNLNINRRHPDIRSPSAPLSPRPVSTINAAPRPFSNIFNFPNHPSQNQAPAVRNGNFSQGLRGKSTSLGRNIAPPTSPSSGVGQFFARMLPLDLSFGKSTSTSCNSSRPTSISIPPTHANNNSSSHQQQLGRHTISFSNNSPIPPPPPPRLRRKLSPVNSLSPVADSPNSPPPVFSPNVTNTNTNLSVSSVPTHNPHSLEPEDESAVIYAEVDKEKKWAARRLKTGEGSTIATECPQVPNTMPVEKVELRQAQDKQGEDEEGIQGSLVITINRDIDRKVVSVQSVSLDSTNEVQNSKESAITVTTKVAAYSSVNQKQFEKTSQTQQSNFAGGGVLNKKKMFENSEDVVVDSWLGKYLKDPISRIAITGNPKMDQLSQNCPKDDNIIRLSPCPDEGQNSDMSTSQSNRISVDQLTETIEESMKPQSIIPVPLSDNASFLFSHLSTVGGDNAVGNATLSAFTNSEESNRNEMQETFPSMTTSNSCHVEPIEVNTENFESSVTVVAEPFSPDSLLQSVDNKIQSVVNRLSNLSGKVSPNSTSYPRETPSPPAKIHEEFESLRITEVDVCQEKANDSKLVALRKTETSSSDVAIADKAESNPCLESTGLSSIVRRRSWNCAGDSSSPVSESSASSSLTNLRDKPYRSSDTNHKKHGSLGWVDEGDSTGVLGDVDTSDAPLSNSSSAQDVGSSFSLRRAFRNFSSFGKSGSSSNSSSSNNGQQKQKRGKDKTKSLMSDANGKLNKGISRQISGPVMMVSSSITTPETRPPEDNLSGSCNKSLTREKSRSHPTVKFSPDVLNNTPPSPHHNKHRDSEGSIGDPGESPMSLIPESERGDDESIGSFSSVSTTGTGYALNMSAGYEDILSELSPNDRKAFYVAREILTSEQTFIDVLDLLTIDFPNAIRRHEGSLKHPIIPPQDLDSILAGLPNLKPVNLELQVDLQERISNWIEHPKLADVIVRKGPFLKLYADYIKNFEKTTLKLDECCHQYPPFSRALQEFEMSDRCHKLGLKHYMLKPVQRMPQYRLLLGDYLKHLEVDGFDYEDTVKALAIVKDVADHANEAIKLQVNADKLLHLQNRLTGAVIMKADRQLLKEGELVKVCRKDLQPRFLALMNDCLLYMSYNYNVGTSGGASKDLQMRNELSLTGMKVCLTASEDYPHEFSVISTARSFNLVAKSDREREDWMKALNDAINDNVRKRTCRTPDQEEGFALGKIAPVWIQDSRVTHCQICAAEFTVLFRRHHCRSCGKVVCKHCSGNQAPLQYRKNNAERVCDECYQYLLEEFDKEARDSTNDGLETSRETIRARFRKVTPNISIRAANRQRGILRLRVPANSSGSRISGNLHWRERKAWKRRWFVLMDRVLYVYAASEDIVAIKTIPVLGWNVDFEKSEVMDGGDNEAVFKLSHLGQNTLLFQADNPAAAEKWVNLMKEATVLT